MTKTNNISLDDDVLKTLDDYKTEHRINSRPVVITDIMREFKTLIASDKHDNYKKIAEYIHERGVIDDATIGTLAVYCMDQLLLQIDQEE